MSEETSVKVPEAKANGDAPVKQEETSAKVEDGVIDKIIKQVEYYFGDINLVKDRFLKEKVKENDGWITIETLLTFNRLKKLSDDAQVIAKAIQSSTSGLLEVNAEGTSIRRSPLKPLPNDTKERRDEISLRTLYIKSFPLDTDLDALREFFEGYGTVDTVFMKRDFHKKTFKGSVFVTFSKKEDAEKFVAEEETKYKDVKIEVKKFRADYWKDKVDERKGGKGKSSAAKGKETKTKTENEGDKEAAKEETVEENEETKAKAQMSKNAVLHIKGMNPETTREEIKNFFADFGEVGWVDFDKGVTEGYVRLREANTATDVLEKAKASGDGKIIIHDSELEVRAVDGEEELEYWKKMFRDIAARKDNKYKKRQGDRSHRGGRRNRGGPQGKRQFQKHNKGEGDDGDEPEAKAAKTESV